MKVLYIYSAQVIHVMALEALLILISGLQE